MKSILAAALLLLAAAANAQTWPAAPVNLAAQCNADGTKAALSWSNVAGSTAYALRLNNEANDKLSCVDGWYCSDPPDKVLNNQVGTSYLATVIAGQPHRFWVHALQAGTYGSAGTINFNCPSSQPPPTGNPPVGATIIMPRTVTTKLADGSIVTVPLTVVQP